MVITGNQLLPLCIKPTGMTGLQGVSSAEIVFYKRLSIFNIESSECVCGYETGIYVCHPEFKIRD